MIAHTSTSATPHVCRRRRHQIRVIRHPEAAYPGSRRLMAASTFGKANTKLVALTPVTLLTTLELRRIG